MSEQAAIGYSGLFAVSGYRYILVAFIARLPLAMSQLGTLMLVVATTGSYAKAGLCAGGLAVANAIGSPLLGALADRIGQAPVILAQCVLGSIGLAVEVLTRALGWHWVVTLVVASVTGLVLPQVGQFARVRWRPMVQEKGSSPALVTTAFSYEGAADEASFVIGPVLVGVFSALLGSYAPLTAGAVMLAVFGVLFARHNSVRLVPITPKGAGQNGSVWTLPFTTLVAAQFLVGNLFGSIQTGTTVLTRAAGYPDAAGLFHALLGIGSVTAGLAIGRLRGTPNYPRRLSAFATAMFVLSVPLFWVNSLPLLAAELFILGFAIAPYMITTFSLGELITDRSHVTTAMTLLAGATGLGYATGAALGGRLVSDVDASGAFHVTLTATTAAFVLAWAARRLLNRTQSPID